ncbi:hypothetical protein ETAA8_62060 [Anatilimnocola aggregata]|uniref:Uncharacterized protein n=1 Tax=Anatilimnocola aggregata TaxID=2528021 RepID=A0A517YLG6_9BACT|nr:hypothetical protein [Anatilimnocola aggregata]QDU31053.1 hypothetical protein ETAA8_62060 [Anatilimnocola aggregata]
MGLSEAVISNIVTIVSEGREFIGRYKDNPGQPSDYGFFSSDFAREHDLSLYFDVIHLAHFGVEDPHLRIPVVIPTAARLACDYFLGDWRENTIVYYEPCDRQKCREVLNWVDEFRMGVLSALLARDYEVLAAICSYVKDDLPPDDGAWRRTIADRRALYFLAEVLPHFVLAHWAAVPPTSTLNKPRAAALQRGIQCIAAGDPVACAKYVTKLVREFIRLDFRPRHSRVPVSWDASILFAAAGLRWPNGLQLPCEVMDFILTKESVGLAN